MKKKLIIIIPTYNRCEDLRLCLSFVMPQVEAYKDNVSVYISDNASTDVTKDVVMEYQLRYPELISYYCQPENLTASPNFDHAVHSVDSEYIYMLSDDDIIVPGFISIMLDWINKYPYVNYFYLNQYVADEEMNKATLFNPNITMDYITIYKEGGELIKEHLDGPSCISTNLFKKEIWADYSEFKKNDCPGYVWLSILSQGVCRAQNVAAVNYPMFTARMPVVQRYSTNWPWYYIKGLGQLFSYLDEIYPGIYDAWMYRQQCERKRRFKIILCDVAAHKKLYRERAKEIKPFIKSKILRVMYSLLVNIIPNWFAQNVMRNCFRAEKLFEYIKK